MSILWPPDAKNQLIGKDPDAGEDWRQEKGTWEDETVRWHHQLNEHEFEQALGDSEGQGSLTCCSPQGRRVRHDLATEQQRSMQLQYCAYILCFNIVHIEDYMIFILQFVVWYVDFACISVMYHTCITMINPLWSWYKIILVCWIQLASILLRIFASIFAEWYWPVISFFLFLFWYLCLVFGIRVMVAS